MRERRRHTPIYVITKGIEYPDIYTVLDGLNELAIQARTRLQCADFFESNHKMPGQVMTEWDSIDSYIEKAKAESDNPQQLNADKMLALLASEPWRYPQFGGGKHFDIMILGQDMYAYSNEQRSKRVEYVAGCTRPGIATVISLYRFNNLQGKERKGAIKTLAMHEFGHLFGLLPADRTKDRDYEHCTNKCVMREFSEVPNDLFPLMHDAIKEPFCPECIDALKRYFRR